MSDTREGPSASRPDVWVAVADMFDSIKNTGYFIFQFGGDVRDVYCITKAGYVREVEVNRSLPDSSADHH